MTSGLTASPSPPTRTEDASDGARCEPSSTEARHDAQWWSRPAVVGAFLTVVCLPLASSLPNPGVDASWKLGLSLVHVRDIAAGPGFTFTYGPLGFLAQPNIVWMPGAIFGLVYVLAVTFALYSLICRCLLRWLAPVAAVAVTALFALATLPVGDVGTVPELATAVLLLWALTLLRPSLVSTMLPLWIPTVFGGVAALQLLVKFSTGGLALGIAVVVAAARPARPKNLGVLAGSFAGSVAVLWLVAQQSLADLPTWLENSLQIAAGYSSAQSLVGGDQGNRYWLMLLIVLAVLLVGLVQMVRRHQVRAVPSVAVVVLAAWFFTKEGFVRLDWVHVNLAFFSLAVLVAAFPWQRRWKVAGVLGVAVALGAVITATGFSPVAEHLGWLGTQTREGLVETARIVRSSVDSSYRDHELDRAASRIRAYDRVPGQVVSALRNGQVHADPTNISAVWAYGLSWRPATIFQTYQANTTALDQANADSLRSDDGPDAVLRELRADSQERLPAWESPIYMVELTCGYRMVIEAQGWQALRRTRDACGPARLISTEVARNGGTLRVPRPENDNDVVVATFDYPMSAAERVLTSLLKPSRFPQVRTNGQTWAFVTGTASDFHLLRVPEEIANRRVTNGGLDIRNLSFPDAPSDVTVRFYELHTDER